jgi:hypothetical protein
MVEERGDGNDDLKISKQDFFKPLAILRTTGEFLRNLSITLHVYVVERIRFFPNALTSYSHLNFDLPNYY